METSAERLKALPHLTVALLQEALHHGFAQIGHRNLPVLSQKMEAMTWKTAPSKHIEAFSLVEGVLFALLSICSNGQKPRPAAQTQGACAGKEDPPRAASKRCSFGR